MQVGGSKEGAEEEKEEKAEEGEEGEDGEEGEEERPSFFTSAEEGRGQRWAN